MKSLSMLLLFSPNSGPLHISLGAHLQPIGIWYSTVWSIWGRQWPLNVSCVLVHARCIASHKTVAYIVSFFEIRGRSVLPVRVLSESLWIIQLLLSRGKFSNQLEIETILQRAVTKNLNQQYNCAFVFALPQHIEEHLPSFPLWFSWTCCRRGNRKRRWGLGFKFRFSGRTNVAYNIENIQGPWTGIGGQTAKLTAKARDPLADGNWENKIGGPIPTTWMLKLWVLFAPI